MKRPKNIARIFEHGQKVNLTFSQTAALLQYTEMLEARVPDVPADVPDLIQSLRARLDVYPINVKAIIAYLEQCSGQKANDVQRGAGDGSTVQEVQSDVPGALSREGQWVWEYIFWRQPHNEGSEERGWKTLKYVMNAYAQVGWELVSNVHVGDLNDGHEGGYWYLTWRRQR